MAMKAQIQIAGIEWTILPAANNFQTGFVVLVHDMFFQSFDDLVYSPKSLHFKRVLLSSLIACPI